MGYYSDYQIEILDFNERNEDDKRNIKELEEFLEEITIYNFEKVYSNQIESMSSVKWYDFEEHMKLIAEKFPHMKILARRFGEDKGDNTFLMSFGGEVSTLQKKKPIYYGNLLFDIGYSNYEECDYAQEIK